MHLAFLRDDEPVYRGILDDGVGEGGGSGGLGVDVGGHTHQHKRHAWGAIQL